MASIINSQLIPPLSSLSQPARGWNREGVCPERRQDTKYLGGEDPPSQDMGERPGKERRTEEYSFLPSRRLLGTPF